MIPNPTGPRSVKKCNRTCVAYLEELILLSKGSFAKSCHFFFQSLSLRMGGFFSLSGPIHCPAVRDIPALGKPGRSCLLRSGKPSASGTCESWRIFARALWLAASWQHYRGLRFAWAPIGSACWGVSVLDGLLSLFLVATCY